MHHPRNNIRRSQGRQDGPGHHKRLWRWPTCILNSAEFTHTQTLTQTHIDTAEISVEAELLFMKYDKVYCSALLLLTIILIILVPLTPNPSLLTFSDFTQFTLIMYYYTSLMIIIITHSIQALCEMQFCLRVWAVQ